MTDKPTEYATHRVLRSPKPIDRQPPKPRRERGIGRPSDASILARAERVAEKLTLIAVRITAELAHLNHLANAPGSPGFEARQTRSVLYCERHECDLDDCKARAEAAGELSTCTGQPLPPRSDPTGEAAFRDPIGRDIRTIADELGRAERSADSIIDVFLRYQPRRANKLERSTTEGMPGCQSCARVKGPGGSVEWWNIPHTDEPTDVGGALDRKWRLCRACYEWVRTEVSINGKARLPTTTELEVKRDTGSWPKRAA